MDQVLSDHVTYETGTIEAVDKNNTPIIIEQSPVILTWYKATDVQTMLDLQKKALPVLAEAFADEVKSFLLDGPSGMTARQDRAMRVEISGQQWEQFFEEKAKEMRDVPFTYFLILAKNSRGEMLGVSAFYICSKLALFFPDFSENRLGDVLLEPIGIIPEAQRYGLARSLVFSILRLAPEIKRILAGTRVWIAPALAIYKAFGFTEYKREGIGVQFKWEKK
jgi:GNAT superfamily N-acetyltransferase